MIKNAIDNSLTRSNAAEIVNWGYPDYDNPITVTASPYTAEKDGLFAVHNDGATGATSITVNGETLTGFYFEGGMRDIKMCAPVSKGDVITWEVSGNSNRFIRLFPAKGE